MEKINPNNIINQNLAKEQLKKQKGRWNDRAGGWDDNISDEGHYTNHENGYEKFLDFEKRELQKIAQAESGIDLGCGTGVTSEILATKVNNIYLLDLADKMLEEAKKKIPRAHLINASAADIPLADNTIDVAISRGIVLSHLPEEMTEDFFNELGRIVRANGVVIFDFLCNPNSGDFENLSPKIPFSKEQIKEKLEARGFDNIIFDGARERVVRVSAIKKE